MVAAAAHRTQAPTDSPVPHSQPSVVRSRPSVVPAVPVCKHVCLYHEKRPMLFCMLVADIPAATGRKHTQHKTHKLIALWMGQPDRPSS